MSEEAQSTGPEEAGPTEQPTIESRLSSLESRVSALEADMRAQGTHHPLQDPGLAAKLAEYGIR